MLPRRRRRWKDAGGRDRTAIEVGICCAQDARRVGILCCHSWSSMSRRRFRSGGNDDNTAPEPPGRHASADVSLEPSMATGSASSQGGIHRSIGGIKASIEQHVAGCH
ncbi:hypothetical protein Ae201684P_001564 [Aphanomyces euteiches]|nr:hypothetical protein Ae201684P_001564 [Aphanomyces euteiches]